jgi:hypothetical protein
MKIKKKNRKWIYLLIFDILLIGSLIFLLSMGKVNQENLPPLLYSYVLVFFAANAAGPILYFMSDAIGNSGDVG